MFGTEVKSNEQAIVLSHLTVESLPNTKNNYEREKIPTVTSLRSITCEFVTNQNENRSFLNKSLVFFFSSFSIIKKINNNYQES